jgi:hypothetical protein
MFVFVLGLAALSTLNLQAQTQLLADPGFEKQSWDLKDKSMASYVSEAAKNGTSGLRLQDDSPEAKAMALSELQPIQGGKDCELRGFVRVKNRVYIELEFFDADKKKISGKLNEGFSHEVKGSLLDQVDTLGEWQEFTVKCLAPPEAAFIRVFLHTYSKGTGWSADFDDLSLTQP